MTVDGKWLTTTIIAIYAAVLSTYNAIQKWRESRVKIKVKLYKDYKMAGGGAPDDRTYMMIIVENHGFRDVDFQNTASMEVEGVGPHFLIPQPITDTKFPHTLKPNSSYRMVSIQDALVNHLRNDKHTGKRRVRAEVWDALGRVHKSDWIDLDV
jgi:hypothetical protein